MPARADELVGRGEHRAGVGQALAGDLAVAQERAGRGAASRCQRRRSSSLSIVMLRWVSSTWASVTVARSRRQPAARVLGPLDEHNRAIEVGLEIAPSLRAEPVEPVEVEMSDRDAPLVAVADRVRRARDGRRRRRARGRRRGRTSSCLRRARRRPRRRRPGSSRRASRPRAPRSPPPTP